MSTSAIKRTRPRGFASWAPRAETAALVNDVKAVLLEYRDHLPLSCRQCFYRLVSNVSVVSLFGTAELTEHWRVLAHLG